MIERTIEKRNIDEYLYSFELRCKKDAIEDDKYIYAEIVPTGKAFNRTIGTNSTIGIAFQKHGKLGLQIIPNYFEHVLCRTLFMLITMKKDKNGPICINLESFVYPVFMRTLEKAVEEIDKEYNGYNTVFVLYLDPKSKYFEFTGVTPEEWELGL